MWRSLTAAALLGGVIGGVSAPVLAQDFGDADALAEIRRELQALREENAELRRRVDALTPTPYAPPVNDGRPIATRSSSPTDTPIAAPPSAPDGDSDAVRQAATAATPRTPVLYPSEGEDPYAFAQQHENYASFSPGRGYKIADTPHGELSVSAYILARYIDQMPGDDTSFTDHLGRERPIDPRKDIQLQRMMVWLNGWVFDPKFRYQTIFWSVNSTNQVAIAGSLTYHFNDLIEIGTGINRLPGTYTMMGSHPYWLAPDRVMADEFFRPGMTSSIWATGEILPRLHYSAMLGDNLSQLGISAVKLTRNNAWAAGLWWMPTTGEFGPRGGMGDYEHHERLATRFGVHYTHSRENRFNQADISSPDNTQIRLADSTLFFETGSLAPGVTVEEADFDLWTANAGFKYRGFALHTEAYYRRLSGFEADGLLPVSEVENAGFYAQGSYDLLAKRLQLYAGTSAVDGDFGEASEFFVGANWFPFDTRNLKINGMAMDVNDSSVNSVFGYYVGGQDGTTITASVDLLY